MDFGPTIDLLIKLGPWALFAYAELRRREEREERMKSQTSIAEYLDKDIQAKDRIARSIRAIPTLVINAMRHGGLPVDEAEGDT